MTPAKPAEGAGRRPARALARSLLLLVGWLAVGGGACARFTKEGADREVYAALASTRARVPEVAGRLDVDAADRLACARRESRTFRLTLEDALALAAAASRDYLRQREDVYLVALDLTGVRNDLTNPLAGLSLGAGTRINRNDTTPQGTVDLTATRNFSTGGRLIVDLASGFLASLASGDPFEPARTLLSLDLLLPMARGAGWYAREPLTQAERDVLYALRSYARFQQSFTVDVVSSYYRLLEARDTWKNEDLTYESLRRLLARQEAYGATGAGRLADFEVDQTRQDLLVAENRRLAARTAYETALDEMKETLGIQVDADVEIPEDALERLRSEGPRAVPVERATAVETALARRLDLENANGREEDAMRRVLVAANQLGPGANLEVQAFLQREPGSRQSLSNADIEAFAGPTIDLPLERTAERNAFRHATIDAMRARRDREALEDQVRLQVREALRQLERARDSYRIEAEGVHLAERRVESTDLLLEASRATTRDRLDAEDALVIARNALTRALVDHAIARLVLLRDVGILQVGSDGRWVEPEAPSGSPTAESPPAPTALAPPATPSPAAPAFPPASAPGER